MSSKAALNDKNKKYVGQSLNMNTRLNVGELNLEIELKMLRKLYTGNAYPSLAERQLVLANIKKILIENHEIFSNALSKDYGYRSEFDSFVSDFIPVISYVKYISKKIKKWMKKEKRHTPLMLIPSNIEVRYQPLGVVGVVVPWNFPINLALSPAISAIGAGNKVMVKMSEFTPYTNRELIKAFEPLKDHIRFYEGEVEVASKFTSLPFDHLLFTGSTNVGRIVAKAAAQNLTPITLELGGKSPIIITQNANLDIAIDNIILGKTLNSGQICVAPDYLFIHSSLHDRFIKLFVSKVITIYSESQEDDLTHIISKHHYDRLTSYIEDAKSKGAKVIKTIELTKSEKLTRLYPTLVTDVSDDMKIMQEEIFGSLLPVMCYNDLAEVYDYIQKKPRPLALYIMSNNRAEADEIIDETHSGGVCVNDTIVHVGADDAPFGGIGDSGMGQYHGREGFLTFSKVKTVVLSSGIIPKNRILMRNKDLVLKLLKRVYLR